MFWILMRPLFKATGLSKLAVGRGTGRPRNTCYRLTAKYKTAARHSAPL